MNDLNMCVIGGVVAGVPTTQNVGAKSIPLTKFTLQNKTGTAAYPKTQAFTVQAWGNVGINARSFLVNGAHVVVTGPLELSTYMTAGGGQQSSWQLTASQIVCLGQAAPTPAPTPTPAPIPAPAIEEELPVF